MVGRYKKNGFSLKKNHFTTQISKRFVSYRLTVVSNHFHSVKILLFSSARSRDFDGLIGIELTVSMHKRSTRTVTVE
jgi:hypothetical protein